jgi:hypothetical protein
MDLKRPMSGRVRLVVAELKACTVYVAFVGRLLYGLVHGHDEAVCGVCLLILNAVRLHRALEW